MVHCNVMLLLFQLITSSAEVTIPEWSGWNTCQSRSQGHTPASKTHVIYHPLIMAKPSDPSTVYTSMIKAKAITASAGQAYTIFTADQQLFKVAVHIMWDQPDLFSNFIPRLGGIRVNQGHKVIPQPRKHMLNIILSSWQSHQIHRRCTLP